MIATHLLSFLRRKIFVNSINYQQDGASAHTANLSQELLQLHFQARVIGKGHVLEWLARVGM